MWIYKIINNQYYIALCFLPLTITVSSPQTVDDVLNVFVAQHSYIPRSDSFALSMVSGGLIRVNPLYLLPANIVTPFFFQYIAVAAGLACTVHAKVMAIPGVSRYSRVGTVTVGGPVTAIERYIDNYTQTCTCSNLYLSSHLY